MWRKPVSTYAISVVIGGFGEFTRPYATPTPAAHYTPNHRSAEQASHRLQTMTLLVPPLVASGTIYRPVISSASVNSFHKHPCKTHLVHCSLVLFTVIMTLKFIL